MGSLVGVFSKSGMASSELGVKNSASGGGGGSGSFCHTKLDISPTRVFISSRSLFKQNLRNMTVNIIIIIIYV